MFFLHRFISWFVNYLFISMFLILFFTLRILFFFKFQIPSLTHLFPLCPPAFYIPSPPPSPFWLRVHRYATRDIPSPANSFRPRATLITINPIYLSLFDYQKFYTYYHITRRILLKTLFDELIFIENYLNKYSNTSATFLRDKVNRDSYRIKSSFNSLDFFFFFFDTKKKYFF